MQPYPQLVLKKGRETSVQRFHPWIFSGALQGVDKSINPGDIVEIVAANGKYLATGHYEGGSIAVKIFSFVRKLITQDFWISKLQNAWNVRRQFGIVSDTSTNAFRLVFGEGDLMPGLIIDLYDNVAVVQAQSVGMYRLRSDLAFALRKVLGNRLKAVYDKSTVDTPALPAAGKWLYGEADNQLIIRENGFKFKIDIDKGQKTGFFLDQRENRKLLTCYAGGKKVLNLFAYTGGFSIYALAAGAEKVVSVDSSSQALSLANENVLLNQFDTASHQGVVADVKDYIREFNNLYDLIIIDPPAFAKHHHSRHKALLGYRFLNESAIKHIQSPGILFTFSCSQAIDHAQFQGMVMAAAIEAGRHVRILHKLGHPPDHPVSLYHPEGEYLKGLVLAVD